MCICCCTLQLFSFFLQFWISSFILQCVYSHVFFLCAYFLVFSQLEYVNILLYFTTFLFLSAILNLLYSAMCMFSCILHLCIFSCILQLYYAFSFRICVYFFVLYNFSLSCCSFESASLFCKVYILMNSAFVKLFSCTLPLLYALNHMHSEYCV